MPAGLPSDISDFQAANQRVGKRAPGRAFGRARPATGFTLDNERGVPIRTKVNASVQIFHVQTEPLSRLSLEFVETLTGMMKR